MSSTISGVNFRLRRMASPRRQRTPGNAVGEALRRLGNLVTNTEQTQEIHNPGVGARCAPLYASSTRVSATGKGKRVFGIRNRLLLLKFLHKSTATTALRFGMIPPLSLGGVPCYRREKAFV